MISYQIIENEGLNMHLIFKHFSCSKIYFPIFLHREAAFDSFFDAFHVVLKNKFKGFIFKELLSFVHTENVQVIMEFFDPFHFFGAILPFELVGMLIKEINFIRYKLLWENETADIELKLVLDFYSVLRKFS